MELINFDNLRQTLEEYAQEVRNLYQDKLIENDRIASGKLLNSVEYRVDFNNNIYSVNLQLQKYWKYIEFGTSPHFPPVNKILEWVKIKPVLPRPDKNGKIPTPKQLAFLIARKISKVGTKGTNDLDEAIKEINLKYQDKLVYALQLDTARIMKVIVGGITGSVPEE